MSALLRRILSPVVRRWRSHSSPLPAAYFTTAPSPQNALDVFKGEWYTSLPAPFSHLRAGAHAFHADPRLAWGLSKLGDLTGRYVLELGPLEGAHTYMLERAGCASVTSIEANPRAYLKCLVLKEVLNLQRSNILCGDFMEYLRGSPPKVDAVIASGVLYHMTNPAELIHLISRITDRLFLWTHYYDEAALARNAAVRRKFTSESQLEHAGFQYQVFRYEYWAAPGLSRFCGGPSSYALWMPRSSIIDCLQWFGFDSVVTGFDEPEHKDGPAFAVVARRAQALIENAAFTGAMESLSSAER